MEGFYMVCVICLAWVITSITGGYLHYKKNLKRDIAQDERLISFLQEASRNEAVRHEELIKLFNDYLVKQNAKDST